MNRELLEKKLKEIDKIIRSQYKNENNLGILSGLSGISLFQFYYSKYLDVNKHADVGVEIITSCIHKINGGYSYPTYCNGIAGTGWVLDHLQQEGFIETHIDGLLIEFDEYLHSCLVSDMKKGDYDFLHGGIGYAFYFLNRYGNTKSVELKRKYKTILLEFIDLLERLSEKDGEDKFKWKSELHLENKEKGYNLSLSHGMSSIVGILTKLYQYDEFKVRTKSMLRGAIAYIISFKSKDSEVFSFFPSWISKNKENDGSEQSRLAWCYGDLGIGMRFWHASKALKDRELADTAISILKHAAKRISPEKSLVKDAGICHGSYGNAQIFYRIYKEMGEPVFKEATEFWIQDGLNKATHKDGLAGYKQWNAKDKEWISSIPLLEGIAGIGLTIIDYLADFDSSWDECLMIS